MITPEEEKEMYEEMIAAEKKQQEEWNKAKEEIKGLIHPKYFVFAENHEAFSSVGVFEIEETTERNNGYKDYPHCKVKNWEDNRLFMHHTGSVESFLEESEYEGEEVEYWVWQTTGFLGDDYSGYLLLPMLDGKFWMISYSC